MSPIFAVPGAEFPLSSHQVVYLEDDEAQDNVLAEEHEAGVRAR